MQKFYRTWKNSLIGVVAIAALFLLIWFEKLPEEATVAALALLVPVLRDMFKQRKQKACEHE